MAVFWGKDPRHAVVLQDADLIRDDHPPAAAEHLDPPCPPFPQHVQHVLEILHMAALVGTDGDALDILLQDRLDHLQHRPVVAQVDHLGPGMLQHAPHDVDGHIMPVKQAGGRDKPGGGGYRLAHGPGRLSLLCSRRLHAPPC